jgi:DNA adenine methylase
MRTAPPLSTMPEALTITADDASSAAASKPFATYPGSKDAAGSAEKIIAAFPPHSVYVECFLGGGATLRRKLPALQTIGIDEDPEVIERWTQYKFPGVSLVQCCALEWLAVHGPALPADALVYADPPYPHGTRSKKKLYRRELTDDEHRRLLDLLASLPCSVCVSSYPNDLYRDRLAGWEYIEFPAMTRGGMRTEALWTKRALGSFGASRFTGRDYRDRERIKRKVGRWRDKFAAMPDAERRVILAALLEEFR